jgi:RNA polymerase sigma factor (sigma-70 family)
MDTLTNPSEPMANRNQHLADNLQRERGRLWRFIRRRIADEGEAEDILQDVLFEFIEAYHLPQPIEQISAWLFRVARYRIIDRFRKKKEEPLSSWISTDWDDDQQEYWLDDLLPPSDGPDTAYAREVLLNELQNAIDELPAEQRDVFIAHELQGRSFAELASETGIKLNTLLARKRYAVLYLRDRLQNIYRDFLGDN